MTDEVYNRYSSFKSYIEEEKYDEARESFAVLDEKLRQFFEDKNGNLSADELRLFTEINDFLITNIPSLLTEQTETKNQLTKLTKGKTVVNAYIGNTKK